MKNLLLAILSMTLLIGCVYPENSLFYDKVPPMERFGLGEKPQKKYTLITVLTDDATEAEEKEVMDEFARKAHKLGGQAIVLTAKEESGKSFHPIDFKIRKTYLYRVDVIRYQE